LRRAIKTWAEHYRDKVTGLQKVKLVSRLAVDQDNTENLVSLVVVGATSTV
jgi:hypothetical protein